MSSAPRVSLGSTVTPGWVTLDLYRPSSVRGDIRALPFRSGCAERIDVSHVLEHIPLRDVAGALREVRRLLAPNGRVLFRGPDTPRTYPAFMRVALEGDRSTPGMAHEWVCGETVFTALVLSAGFVLCQPDDDWPPSAWPCGEEVQLSCQAVR